MLALQHQHSLVAASNLPVSAFVVGAIALPVGHARRERVIRKEIHLIANAWAIGARQLADKGRWQSRDNCALTDVPDGLELVSTLIRHQRDKEMTIFQKERAQVWPVLDDAVVERRWRTHRTSKC